jgi:RNA polymerase sigma-70 factor (TIGR02960 family)
MDADEVTFSALFDRHRRELQAHCYRMVGSLEDAEDLVQETFARAWRARFRRGGRWSFRAWLYRIATNACLDHLARRAPRLLPADVASAANPEAEPPPVATDVRWLDPYPDRLVDPHEAAVARETLEIAFVAAVQHLPPRQRGALILRDAAGFSARETAMLLGTSVPAVKARCSGAAIAFGRGSDGTSSCSAPRRRSLCPSSLSRRTSPRALSPSSRQARGTRPWTGCSPWHPPSASPSTSCSRTAHDACV